MKLDNLPDSAYCKVVNFRDKTDSDGAVYLLNNHQNVQRVLKDFPPVLWDLLDGFNKDFGLIFHEEGQKFQFVFVFNSDALKPEFRRKDLLLVDSKLNDSFELLNLPSHWSKIPLVKLGLNSEIEIIRG